MAPAWTDGQITGAGFLFNVDTIDLDLRTVHRNYRNDDIAVISAKFSNKVVIKILIGQNDTELFSNISVSRKVINSKSSARMTKFGIIRVMPPIGMFITEERLIKKDYLIKSQDGRLAYRHFRNQLYAAPEKFDGFSKMVAETWPGIIVNPLEQNDQTYFSLMAREGPHPSEIAWIGSGLQAWLQTIWFLCRVQDESIIVLDEPDVYLHSDVQRKLVKLLTSGRFKQTIVATHSTDIISDVSPNYVVVIDKRADTSKSLTAMPGLQDVLSEMGSAHNIQFSKLGSKGSVLFVEGNDASYLSDVAAKSGAKSLEHFTGIPTFPLGGKSNWHWAIGAAQIFNKTSDGRLNTYALLDGDFLSSDERVRMIAKAHNGGLILHIWERYEFENYFLCPETIATYIYINSTSTTTTAQEITDIIEDCSELLKSDALVLIADHIQKTRKEIPSKMLQLAQSYLEAEIERGKRLDDIISGKSIFGKLSSISKSKFGVSFGPQSISRRIEISRIPEEMRSFVHRLD